MITNERTIDYAGHRIRVADIAYDRNAYWAMVNKRAERRDWAPSCEICGRKVGKNDLYIFDLDGGTIVHPDDVATAMKADPTASWIGWCRVGPSHRADLAGWTLTVAEFRRRHPAD